MYHIHIVHAKKDWAAAVLLSGRLKRYYRQNRKIASAVVRRDGSLYSGNPEDQNYLIVLCSFHTVRDPGIEAAISRFSEHEPLSHIICYTIRGIPCAKDSENECLPHILTQLTQHDLLAINSVELGNVTALHKIISSLHGIPMRELEQRYNKQIRQHYLLIALLYLFYAADGIWSEYTATSHEEYYRTYSYRNGVPVGIDKLYTAALANCSDYYVFKVHENLPVSIQRIGSPAGVRSADPDIQAFYDAIDSPYIEFSYHTDDTLDAAVHADQEGYILFVMNYSAGTTAVDFSRYPDGWTPYFLTLNGERTNFSRCLFVYDSEGQLSEIQYFSNSRNLQP